MNRTFICLIAPLLVCTLVSPAIAATNQDFHHNWPNYRGPEFNGSSTTATPPVRWSENQNVKWKVELPGPGNNASPIVWNDRVFVLTAVSDSPGGTPTQQPRASRRGQAAPLVPTKFMTICYARSTGKELWRQIAVETTPHEGHHPDHGFASASPFTDGEHVYSHFGSRGLYCYDMDGNLVWKRDDLGRMQTRGSFGEGSTPVLHENTIVIPWDHEGPSFVMAVDKRTGKSIWKKDRDEPSSWVCPLVVDVEEKKLAIVGGQNFTRGYDLATGQERWRASGTSFRPTAGPVTIDNLVLVASNRRNFFLGALRFDSTGNLNQNSGIAWSQANSSPDVPSLLLSDDRVYYVKGNSNIFNCSMARTGEPLFSDKRLDALNGIYSSPVAADGKVYVVGRNGVCAVLEDSGKLNLLATNTLDDRIDATPALAGSEMFLRGKKYLYCISEE